MSSPDGAESARLPNSTSPGPTSPDGADVAVSPRRVRRTIASAGAELAAVGGLYVLYRAGRQLGAGKEELARKNAGAVFKFERFMRLPSEVALQSLFDADGLVRLANVYYTGVHFPLMIAFLLWGYLRRPRSEYCWARNLVVLQTAGALLVHVLYPLAPPRMFPQWGFVDTMARYGPSAYDGAAGEVANQFAAMPSLHVGWAALIAYIVMRTARWPIAAAAVAHALLTTLVVVVTANHWWVDALAGVLVLVAAQALLRSSPWPRAGSLGRSA